VRNFGPGDQLRRAQFTDTDLRGARFVRSDLSGAQMRAVDVGGTSIDAPWLLKGRQWLLVNDVDVVPYIEQELNRRFPGRSQRTADDPQALREAWTALEEQWRLALQRAQKLPAGSVEIRVDGEWSFAQTLRHLIMATDTWLGKAILQRSQPYHPIGQPHHEYAADGYDLSVFSQPAPDYEFVLRVRAERQGMVSQFLEQVGTAELEEAREHPWGPGHRISVRSCLHTILEEEWEHLRFAVRDLEAIASGPLAP